MGIFDKLREKLLIQLSVKYQLMRTLTQVSKSKKALIGLCILLDIEDSSRSQEDAGT